MDEIEKIKYRILELETRIASEPKRDVINYTDYSKGYLDALKDTLELLTCPQEHTN